MAASRFLGRLERIEPARTAPDGGRDLAELRAKMAEILGRPREAAEELRVQSSAPRELPLAPYETEEGVARRKLRRVSGGEHVGSIPLSGAGSAFMELLALLALSPELAELDPTRLLYFDTETTGLFGAGVVPFVYGLAWFDAEKTLHFEQIFLPSPGDEPVLLRRLGELFEECDGIVSFNGRTFDEPLLRSRGVMNRMPRLPERPHLDLLHVARRLHKARIGRTRLVDLESEVLGFLRGDDVSGAEIAPRYAHFLRTGDASAIEPILTHNEWDVLSMVALVGLYGDPVDLLHPADLAEGARVLSRAREFETGISWAEIAREKGASVAANRALACLHRARGDRARALVAYEELAQEIQDPRVRLELVKLYEHHEKDFRRALEILELGTGEPPARLSARRARLERKAQCPPKARKRKGSPA